MPIYKTLAFTTEFFDSLTSFPREDIRRIGTALKQLDADETFPSLQVHQLKDQRTRLWTAYATRNIRITFRRLPDGRKELMEASHHYGD